MDVNNTFDSWAEWYDYMFKGREEDVKFYVKEAKKAKGKVLEIACGTGRVYLELLRNGIDAYGIDISDALLNVLRNKAKKEGLEAKVYNQDMRYFKFDEKFDRILLPFSSFLHNTTYKDQITTLKNIYKHLNEGGKLIIDFFLPDYEYMCKSFNKKVRDLEFVKDGKEYVVYKNEKFDPINQIIYMHQDIVEKNTNSKLGELNFTIRYIYKNEFELLLRLAGFSKWRVYGGFNYEPLKSKEQRLVWVVEK